MYTKKYAQIRFRIFHKNIMCLYIFQVKWKQQVKSISHQREILQFTKIWNNHCKYDHQEWEMNANGYIILRVMRIATAAKNCEYTKNCWIHYSKLVNCMVCELYSSKAVFLKSNKIWKCAFEYRILFLSKILSK